MNELLEEFHGNSENITTNIADSYHPHQPEVPSSLQPTKALNAENFEEALKSNKIQDGPYYGNRLKQLNRRELQTFLEVIIDWHKKRKRLNSVQSGENFPLSDPNFENEHVNSIKVKIKQTRPVKFGQEGSEFGQLSLQAARTALDLLR